MCFIFMMGLVAGMTAQDDCPYDLNGDGCTCANEILLFLSNYGVAGNTDYDFNDNGFRDFEDALMLSRHLGTQCPQAEVQATTGIISGLLIEPVDTFSRISSTPATPSPPATSQPGRKTSMAMAWSTWATS